MCMFIVLRKNNIILFTCIVLITYFTCKILIRDREQTSVATFAIPTEGKVVVIDAGHGGKFNTINSIKLHFAA